MGIIAGIVFLVMTFFALRGGWTTPGQRFKISFSGQAILLAVLSIAAAMFFFGPVSGLAIVAIIAVHEFGHVAAFRICGHTDATFRLIPLMGGVAISKKRPDGPLQDFFISIMGPAICLAPTILALAIVYAHVEMHPLLFEFIWSFGIFSGALNFFNLLPIGPLDGGKCTRIIMARFFPSLEKPFSIFMMGVAILAGVYLQSIFIIILTLMALPNVLNPQSYVIVRALTRNQGLLLIAIYLMTMATFFMAGFPVFEYYLIK